MGSLSKHQIEQISKSLQVQGITFDPLRMELLDHLICDIEIQMEQGSDFDHAWLSVKKQIPKNHLKNIQTETMELLNKKYNPVRILTVISFALLAFATLFKILHLSGAGVLLLAFLATVSITLLIGSTKSVYVNREFKGRGIILLMTVLVISFITGLCFKILHLPGSEALLYFFVTSICILFPALSLYFYVSNQKSKDYLLIKLIEENQSVIENTALTLIGFGLIFNYSSLLFGGESLSGTIFFIFSVVLTGMYVYTLTWAHYMESDGKKGHSGVLLLIFSSLTFIMFMLPLIGGGLHVVLRHVSAYLPGVILSIIIFIHYVKFSSSRHKSVLATLSSFLIFYPLLRLGTKLEWFGGFLNGLTTNSYFIIGFLAFLIALLISYRKEKPFNALIILTMASHMIPNI